MIYCKILNFTNTIVQLCITHEHVYIKACFVPLVDHINGKLNTSSHDGDLNYRNSSYILAAEKYFVMLKLNYFVYKQTFAYDVFKVVLFYFSYCRK